MVIPAAGRGHKIMGTKSWAQNKERPGVPDELTPERWARIIATIRSLRDARFERSKVSAGRPSS
jgi:hypothetical protein